MRSKIAAGNWKMNTSLQEGMELVSEIANMLESGMASDVKVILSPPYTHLASLKKMIGDSTQVSLGAQNCHQEAKGAFTGEISVAMLKEVGATYVIVGHSERREYFNETYALLEAKTRAVLDSGLRPIFCCGEKLDVRENGNHFELVEEQLSKSIFSLSKEDFLRLVIAYEPVWAIGTGVTASADQAQEMHAHIRNFIRKAYDEATAQEISILYGGSVNASNARELFACPDVDGGLVGGASLKSKDFVTIAKSFE